MTTKDEIVTKITDVIQAAASFGGDAKPFAIILFDAFVLRRDITQAQMDEVDAQLAALTAELENLKPPAD